MSTLLYTLGRWSFRHSWRVLIGWLLILAAVGGAAAGLNKGFDNSFSIPGTEAQEGLSQLNRTFPQVSGTSAQFIVVAADGDDVTDAAYRDPIEDIVAELEDVDGVSSVTSPYDEMVTGMVSDDDTAAITRLQFEGTMTDITDDDKEALHEVVDGLIDELPDGSQVALGGELFATELPTITLTEAVGVIIALLVLIVTFRSFVLAGLPLGVALIGVGVSMLGILAATQWATVSATTPMLALMLGLAVGIDYALFIAARHQDQVRDGMDPEESAGRATGTAGSAVVFAGVTVLIALVGLGFAGIPFLTTMGIAAAVAVAVAVLIAVTLTPAVLGFVGHRATGRAPRPRRARKGREATPRRGFAARWVGGVTRHPIVTTVAVVLGLGLLAAPVGSLALALPNAGVLPKDNEARIGYDLTSEHFGAGFNGPLILTGTIVTSTDPVGLMDDLKEEVEAIDGVKEVALATPNETADTGIVQVVPETGPDDPATSDLVRELRSHHDEWLDEYGIDLKITGSTAVGIDISDRLGAALVPFGIFVVGLSFILLMIVFRSIWVPLKAALGYLLSILAAFGVVAAVFSWGWGADLLHVTRTGPIIAFMPIVVMGVLFGLAMDYEVFLVSRMREDFVHAARRLGATRDVAVDAVRSGFTASARVVTAAAVIMFAVFAAFVPEGDSNLKPIALALAVGIAVDAFVVRMTLVPAVMALLGDKAWWMPKWLDRLLPHFDIEGEAVERERALADWPEPASTAVVAAEGLEVAADDVVLASGATFRAEPGEALVVTSADPRSARAVGLAVAGRTPASDGLLRVAGHLLPGRAAWVRTHVGLALLGQGGPGSDEPARAVRLAARGGTRLLVVDGADAIDPAERDQVAAVLRDARRSLEPTPLTVVLTGSDSGTIRGLLADAGWDDPRSVSVGTSSPSSTAHALSEVNA
ncbi:MMPL family transporter [Microbacterium marinilacus]|uniref:MMPL family transporter n=1 Tax=Microbacterium marinilacus TaxID=415209 RepID=A0ABP7BDN3_9MICO|nr:MMPL family transporter [Microbacterium marinilacus]MBY0686957.1 MMPL family transporter [Microbacterium marinilacus]